MSGVGILGIGSYLPERILTNDDIKDMGVDTTDEWIVERTGIKQRHIAHPDQATSDLAYHASVRALESAGISADQVDLIILATSTPDHLLFPSTACILQRLLEIKRPIPAFDMSAACTGFNYAISTGAQFVASGSAKYVLVVAADVLSKFMDWKDRGTCILFGDGAGAVVLGPTASGCGILTSDLFSNGEFADILRAKHGGSRYSLQENSPLRPLIEMEGKSVFKVAVNTVVPAIETVLAREGVAVSDIKLVVFHQANVRIIDMAKDRLGLSDDQLIITLPLYGNTSAASIPIALNEAVKQGRVVKGDLIVLVGFGAGFTWGVNLVRWCI